jgi:hypothetical protein
LPDRAVSIVLLLGSYDDTTKALLDNLKEEIAKVFSGKVFAFLLQNLELYMTKRFEVLAEIESGHQITVYLFEGPNLYDVQDLNLEEGENPDVVINNYLSKRYNTPIINKRTLSTKYDLLMSLALEIFLVRDLELTRGGEYIELMHALFAGQSGKVWFFRNNLIVVSSMLMEYLDMFRVNMRIYRNYDELETGITRIISHSIENEE